MTVIEKLQMNANQANSDFVAIKNKIVEKGVEVADGTRTSEYAGKVDEVFNKGAEQINRTLYGAYILKDNVDVTALIDKYGFFEEDFSGKEIYAYFVDNYGSEYKYASIGTLKLYLDEYDSNRLEFCSDITQDQWGNEMKFRLYYAPHFGAEYGYIYDGEYSMEWDAPDMTDVLQSMIVMFTQPVVVSQEIYDIINSITDNSQMIVERAVEVGQKKEAKTFWNSINPNENTRAYASPVWNNVTFKPTKNIEVYSKHSNMFAYDDSVTETFQCNISNLENCLKANDVYLNINTTALNELFGSCTKFVTIGRVRYKKGPLTRIASTFYKNKSLVTIKDALPVNDATTFDGYVFYLCFALQDVRFDGVIGQNGLNLQWSDKLSKASWISIINALSETTSGLSITGSLESVNMAFETSAGAKDGSTSAEWLNLIANKNNWTVNLV